MAAKLASVTKEGLEEAEAIIPQRRSKSIRNWHALTSGWSGVQVLFD